MGHFLSDKSAPFLLVIRAVAMSVALGACFTDLPGPYRCIDATKPTPEQFILNRAAEIALVFNMEYRTKEKPINSDGLWAAARNRNFEFDIFFVDEMTTICFYGDSSSAVAEQVEERWSDFFVTEDISYRIRNRSPGRERQ